MTVARWIDFIFGAVLVGVVLFAMIMATLMGVCGKKDKYDDGLDWEDRPRDL